MGISACVAQLPLQQLKHATCTSEIDVLLNERNNIHMLHDFINSSNQKTWTELNILLYFCQLKNILTFHKNGSLKKFHINFFYLIYHHDA